MKRGDARQQENRALAATVVTILHSPTPPRVRHDKARRTDILRALLYPQAANSTTDMLDGSLDIEFFESTDQPVLPGTVAASVQFRSSTR